MRHQPVWRRQSMQQMCIASLQDITTPTGEGGGLMTSLTVTSFYYERITARKQ